MGKMIYIKKYRGYNLYWNTNERIDDSYNKWKFNVKLSMVKIEKELIHPFF